MSEIIAMAPTVATATVITKMSPLRMRNLVGDHPFEFRPVHLVHQARGDGNHGVVGTAGGEGVGEVVDDVAPAGHRQRSRPPRPDCAGARILLGRPVPRVAVRAMDAEEKYELNEMPNESVTANITPMSPRTMMLTAMPTSASRTKNENIGTQVRRRFWAIRS